MIRINWEQRMQPMTPAAAVARGETAKRLAEKLLQSNDENYLASLRGAASRETMIVLAGGDNIPWVDGIRYFGLLPDVPLIYFPTNMAPDIDPFLIYHHVFSKMPRGHVIIDAREKLLIPLRDASPLSSKSLTYYLESDL